MGISDMFGKAKKLADDNAEKIEGALDKGVDAVKKKTPDNVDGYLDKANDAAKGAIGKDQEPGTAGGTAPSGSVPPQ